MPSEFVYKKTPYLPYFCLVVLKYKTRDLTELQEIIYKVIRKRQHSFILDNLYMIYF